MLNWLSNFILNHTPLFYWTQSLWRDEAFSVWIAEDSFSEVIRRTSGDFNPPLYYFLLNIWMRLFGRSEMALRSLSIVFFLAFLWVVYAFAKKMFKSQHLASVTTWLAALNPMLLYFAFELRMYSLLTLLSTLSMYLLYTQQWFWYIIITTLGLYTQPFMAFVVVTQCFYLILTRRFKTALRNVFFVGLLYLPWAPTLLNQFRASGPMWMYPVDAILVFSVLGNLFWGYEGTPGNLWWFMILTSLALTAIFIWLGTKRGTLKQSGLLISWLVIPIVLVLGISVFKPIYVHRYLIYSTVAEVLMITWALSLVRSKVFKKLLIPLVICLLVVTNIWVVSFHRKVDIRSTFNAIRPQFSVTDQIAAKSPLVFYESLFYAPPGATVYLYNPDSITPPRYVGSIGMPESSWIKEFPQKPLRGFLIYEDGHYEIVSKQ